MLIELVHIGFDNFLDINRVIAIASPNSAAIKRTMKEWRNKGLLIDMTHGRRTKAVIITESGHIFLAALAPETIAGRLQASRAEGHQTATPSSYAQREGSVVGPEQSNEKGEL